MGISNSEMKEWKVLGNQHHINSPGMYGWAGVLILLHLYGRGVVVVCQQNTRVTQEGKFDLSQVRSMELPINPSEPNAMIYEAYIPHKF